MRALAVCLALICGVAEAAPETSVRPQQRDPSQVTVEPSGSITQRPRDDAATRAALPMHAMTQSLRPKLRSNRATRAARAQDQLRKRGAVCGDPDIQGDHVGRVNAGNPSCGVEDAVRVRSISGVELSQRSVMDCKTAAALKTWIEKTAKPTFSRTGGGLKRLRVAAHYACRTRNNQPGGRVSEHGKGRAIDISGVRLRDGTLITVQNGWNGRETRDALRALHRGACGPFGTVLGPNSDRFHRDHFHFDTARHRGGPYCR